MTSLYLPCIVPVAGVSFRQSVVRMLVEEQLLIVRRDTENPHDAYACIVETLSGEHVGFIPKELARRLSDTDSKEWQAKVVDVLRGETWGLRIEVQNRKPQPVIDPEWPSGTERAAGVDNNTQWGTGHKRVRGLSGRDLGVLIKSEGGRVLVEKKGSVVSYPAQIVTVEQ